MNFLNGYKTYIGSLGLIFIGFGQILAHEGSFSQALTKVALGLIGVGARSFGNKIIEVIKAKQP